MFFNVFESYLPPKWLKGSQGRGMMAVGERGKDDVGARSKANAAWLGGLQPRGLVTRHAASGASPAVHDRVSLKATRRTESFKRPGGTVLIPERMKAFAMN